MVKSGCFNKCPRTIDGKWKLELQELEKKEDAYGRGVGNAEWDLIRVYSISFTNKKKKKKLTNMAVTCVCDMCILCLF